jgi:hypothetical protein
MPSVDFVQVLAALTCIWTYTTSKQVLQAATLRSRIRLLAPLSVGVALALAPLLTEWTINKVAGQQVAPPTTPFTPARVADSPVPIMAAHSLGSIETAVERNRIAAASMVVALLASLCIGLIGGRRGRNKVLPPAHSKQPHSAA